MTMLDLSLLPDTDERIRCAEFTRSLAVDPVGTAIRADMFVAVETPMPWPKPVFAHPGLLGVPDLVAQAPQPTRVLAAVPRESDALAVVVYRRDPGNGAVQRDEWATDVAALESTVGSLVHGRLPDDADRVDAVAPAAEVWICTQGSHDMCCGSDGTRLAAAVDGRWTDVVVRRVSHTGGHRFAPTALTLPDGRMWANLDGDILESVLRRQGDPRSLSGHCRGWWGSAQGAEQVAERAVFASEGWVWEPAPRWTELVGEHDGVTTIRVSVGAGRIRSWLATVAVGREVPTITCRAPGGQPAKAGQEFVLLDLVSE